VRRLERGAAQQRAVVAAALLPALVGDVEIRAPDEELAVGLQPPPQARAYGTLAGIAGDALLSGTDWGIGFSNPRSVTFPDSGGARYGSRGPLPTPVLEAMQALAEVEGLAAPDDRVTLSVRWIAGPDGPAHLAVKVDLDLIEFVHVPGTRTSGLPGREGSRVVGLAYTFRPGRRGESGDLAGAFTGV
jgi:hypothetical protein